MGLDIRLPLGALFVVLGLLLVAAGAGSGPEQNVKSLGLSLNLIWGLVLLGFGGVMLWLGRRTMPR